MCSVSPHQLTIRAGSSDRTTGGQLVGIHHIYYPGSFNIDTFDHDIAILELKIALVYFPTMPYYSSEVYIYRYLVKV